MSDATASMQATPVTRRPRDAGGGTGNSPIKRQARRAVYQPPAGSSGASPSGITHEQVVSEVHSLVNRIHTLEEQAKLDVDFYASTERDQRQQPCGHD